MTQTQEFIAKIRNFNRFYTNIIGLLEQRFLDRPYSLTEGRVLYEISHIEECTAKKIRENIVIDEGYLSRIIDKFIQQGLVRKTQSSQDRRLYIIVLTEKGRKEFQKLNKNSNQSISQLIEKLSEQQTAELVGMMERIQKLLERPQ